MREIKFRGKRVNNGEWVYGAVLVTSISGVYIIGTKRVSKPTRTGVGIKDVAWQHEVDPETVGQFTGLYDKNGREIYDGDVVCVEHKKSDYQYGQLGITGEICYKNGQFNVNSYEDWGFDALGEFVEYWDVEVIGNIWDNPELLKGCEE